MVRVLQSDVGCRGVTEQGAVGRSLRIQLTIPSPVHVRACIELGIWTLPLALEPGLLYCSHASTRRKIVAAEGIAATACPEYTASGNSHASKKPRGFRVFIIPPSCLSSVYQPPYHHHDGRLARRHHHLGEAQGDLQSFLNISGVFYSKTTLSSACHQRQLLRPHVALYTSPNSLHVAPFPS